MSACLLNDLARIVVPGIPYSSGNFTVPGVGMIQLVMAGPDQVARKVLSGGQVLIKGKQCQAAFMPTVPAFDSAGVPDPTAASPTFGKGEFMVAQNKVKAN